MYPPIGNAGQPVAQLSAQVVEITGLTPAQKTLAQIADTTLDLALGLRTIGMTQTRSKAPVTGEIQKGRMPDDLAALARTQDNRLDPVIQDFLGNPAQLPEGFLVHPQERG